MLLAGALSDAYLEIHDNPAGVGQGRYYFTEFDPVTGQDTHASAETIIFGPGGDPEDPPGGGGGGGSSPDVPSMTTEYIHADHLGSTRLVTDEMGLEIAQYKYYPFGHYAETSSGSDVRMKFTGHERDESLGLDYMLARYYSAGLGRFLSVDPLGSSGRPAFPQTWNRFAYVANNPIVLLDPDGMEDERSDLDKERLNDPDSRDKSQEAWDESNADAKRPEDTHEKGFAAKKTDDGSYETTELATGDHKSIDLPVTVGGERADFTVHTHQAAGRMAKDDKGNRKRLKFKQGKDDMASTDNFGVAGYVITRKGLYRYDPEQGDKRPTRVLWGKELREHMGWEKK